MTAKFALEGQNRIVLVLTPDYGDEDLLMAAWLRYDANQISADVERHENGRIQTVTLLPSQAK